MKYKYEIVGITVLLVIFGGVGAVWQFYFRDLFEGYRQDDQYRATLQSTFERLEETFRGYDPELLIEEWQNKIQPWRNAREERARFFNYGDWYEIDVVPDETRMLKFWYTDVSNEMLYDLYTRVFEQMGDYTRFPQDIRTMFNIAREEDWAGRDVSREEVESNLRALAFASALSNLLLDHNVTSVRRIEVWPRRVPQTFNGLVDFQTIGLHVTIQARDMVRLFETLRQEQRYFGVEAIKVAYPYIGYGVEPQLDVQFLLTQANYLPPDDREIDRVAAETPDAPRMAARPERPAAMQRAVDVQPSRLRRFWIWFRRTVLYIP